MRIWPCALSSLAALIVSAPASAVPINHGDFVGSTVTYLQVTEDSGTDATPLFGAPSVFADVLDFNPVSFNSSSTGAGGVDITDGTLTFMVTANPGNVIDELAFSEAGDFTLTGPGGVGTFAGVTSSIFIDIVEVDGSGITPVQVITSMTFAPSAGNWDLLNDGPGPLNGIWTGGATVDLLQALIDENVPFTSGVTKVNVSLDNTLSTTSEDGTSSFIAKKDTKGLSVTTPEPSTVVLLAGGLLALARRRG